MSCQSYLLSSRGWRFQILITGLLIVPINAFAQTPSSGSPSPQVQPTPSLERRFFKNILRDQREIWTSPLRLSGDDAKWLVPLAASTSALIATDRRTAGALDDDKTRLRVSRDISRLGATYTTAGVAATFYLVGRARRDARARETGLLAAEALINAQIVTRGLKVVTQRPRPRRRDGRGRFFDGGNSFPSGHASSIWSVATVIASEYGEHRPLVRVGVYALATGVSLSRYTGRSHFLSDVLVGSAIGYGIGRYVYRTNHDPHISSGAAVSHHPRSKLIPLIAPSYNRRARGYGVSLAWSF